MTPKNLRSIRLYRKLFIETTISQNLNKIFLFYKNWLVVCTSSFHIRGNVIFSKKKMSDPPMPLIFSINILFETSTHHSVGIIHNVQSVETVKLIIFHSFHQQLHHIVAVIHSIEASESRVQLHPPWISVMISNSSVLIKFFCGRNSYKKKRL